MEVRLTRESCLLLEPESIEACDRQAQYLNVDVDAHAVVVVVVVVAAAEGFKLARHT